jgi:hypothetical protein
MSEQQLVRAEAVAHRGRDAWIWHVAHCPFCGKEHWHGGGTRERPAFLGARAAHCTDGGPRPQYELVEKA